MNCNDEAASIEQKIKIDLEKIPGRYWRVGMLGGNPVFRQEPPVNPDDPNSLQLFLWHTKFLDEPDGWYLSESLEPDRRHEALGWGPKVGLLCFPEFLHIPAKARKPSQWVQIGIQHTKAQLCIDDLLDKVEKLEKEGPEVQVVEAEKKDHHREKEKTRSGWFEKCRKLIQAVQAKDWGLMHELVELVCGARFHHLVAPTPSTIQNRATLHKHTDCAFVSVFVSVWLCLLSLVYVSSLLVIVTACSVSVSCSAVVSASASEFFCIYLCR